MLRVPDGAAITQLPRPPADPARRPTEPRKSAIPHRGAIAARSVGGNGGMVPSHRSRRHDARGNSLKEHVSLFCVSEYTFGYAGPDGVGLSNCSFTPVRYHSQSSTLG